MKFSSTLLCVAASIATSIAPGQTQGIRVPAGTSVEVVTPVFHQLVAYNLPAGFTLNSPEQSNAKSYLRETVLKGETPERWTQMITLSGHRGLGTVSAQLMIDTMTAGIKSSCPQTFALKNIGAIEVSGAPAYLALVSCGRVADTGGAPGAFHSETAMILAIRGSEDMYTLQYAERARSSESAIPFDEARWQARLAALKPIRVCARVEGEQAPYPSCVGK